MGSDQQANKITYIVQTCEKCGFKQIVRYYKQIKNCLHIPPICCRICFGNCQPSIIDSKLNKYKAVFNE